MFFECFKTNMYVQPHTWLEELASESNTIQAQEDITQAGKIAGKTRAKLYVILRRFIINISGLVNLFGLALGVAQGIISLLHWIATGPSGKSIGERTRWDTDFQ